MLIKKSFTLIEIIVVLVIMSLMAGFGIPSFSKAIQNAEKNEAVLNLKVIHAASVLYKARTGYYPQAGSIESINLGLKLNIIANGAFYKCDQSTRMCWACSDVDCSSPGFIIAVSLSRPLAEGGTCSNPAIDGINPGCWGGGSPPDDDTGSCVVNEDGTTSGC